MTAFATMRRGFGRALMAALFAGLALAGADPAAAQDGPRMGEYQLRQGNGEVWTGNIVLRGDGTYELYDMPTRHFRGKGGYRYDAAASRVVWLSGINKDMGRGGTFSAEKGGRAHIIRLGTNTYAINQ